MGHEAEIPLGKGSQGSWCLVKLTYTWTQTIRQWWDDLFTGRYERTLKDQLTQRDNRISQLEAELTAMRLAIMPLTGQLGAAYSSAVRPVEPPAYIEPSVLSWAQMQERPEPEKPQ